MNNRDFSIMDETVDKICESLLSEPEKWSFETYYIVSPKKFNSISIHKGLSDQCISVKNSSDGIATSRVFSIDQGEKIKKAYYKALSILGSNKQKEIINNIMNETKKIDTKEIINTKKKEKSCAISWILLLIAVVILILKQ